MKRETVEERKSFYFSATDGNFLCFQKNSAHRIILHWALPVCFYSLKREPVSVCCWIIFRLQESISLCALMFPETSAEHMSDRFGGINTSVPTLPFQDSLGMWPKPTLSSSVGLTQVTLYMTSLGSIALLAPLPS